jgi:tryptophanyl-tRNA synthetase
MTASGADRKVVLTALKPTGEAHAGNYVGMFRPALSSASEHPEYQFLYFIADYHALTKVRDPERFRHLCYDNAAAWIALGLDTHNAILYRQSDVPEVFELAWLLSCVTPKGLMNRAHAYKAAVAANRRRSLAEEDAGINMGLYNYPILMAADILLFQTDLVPVGKDQVQHVEFARDIAGSFNSAYGPLLKLPQHVVGETIPGLDGRKMSASLGNTIPLFAPPEELRKRVYQVRTDSSAPDAPKDPTTSTLFLIYEQFATAQQTQAMRERYLAGRVSWEEAKRELSDILAASLAGPRRLYHSLMSDTRQLDEAFAEGGRKARALAGPLMERVRKAIGRP